MASTTEAQQKDEEEQQLQQQASTDPAPIAMTESPATGGAKKDRRLSDEWGSAEYLVPPDASKVPPSRFQKRKGSIYATPNSRDGHIDRNYADKYHAKIAEMKGGK
ncbi:Uncharacterized protein TPAR_02385 [Tolypocladium paradoxum]|uniref:Uncharacterized protein n=1 Tax=Tolypocladium paradoxum TaxID=94208 RepID=A0A2S4L4Q2_9HYPO|nr:Uncharacterized protein TPAR_02385 [Tolypocladium paradoxum]